LFLYHFLSTFNPHLITFPSSNTNINTNGKRKEKKERKGKRRERKGDPPNQYPTTILLSLTTELSPPMVISVLHSFRLQELRTVDEIPERVEAEAEVFGRVHAVATLVAGAFVVGVEG
jgi:hypothetical protein